MSGLFWQTQDAEDYGVRAVYWHPGKLLFVGHNSVEMARTRAKRVCAPGFWRIKRKAAQ